MFRGDFQLLVEVPEILMRFEIETPYFAPKVGEVSFRRIFLKLIHIHTVKSYLT